MFRYFSFILAICLTIGHANWVHAQDPSSTKDGPSANAATPPPAPTPSKKSDITEILDSMGYPELQVVPRASERLAIEAKYEDNSWIFEHWTLELSGLSTLAVGFMSSGNYESNLTTAQHSSAALISTVTSTIGASWMVGGVLLGADRPYRTGASQISKYPGKDERSALTKERMAEEALERPAKTMRVVEYFAVTTNLSASVLSALYTNQTGRIMAGVSGVMALMPLLFQDHSIAVYDKQMEYKKKIYAPLHTASLAYDPHTKTVTPMSNLVWSF